MTARPLAVLALCAFSLAAHAADPALPTLSVEYSADRTITTDSGAITGRVFATAQKERMEMNTGGMQSVMILRRDTRTGTMLMPAQRMAMDLGFAQAQQQSASAPGDGVSIREIGKEKVEGMQTTKYQVTRTDGGGSGHLWVTRDGIVMKMEMLTQEHGKKTRVSMALRNVKVGRQPASLFEVPPGYTRMPAMSGRGMPGAPPRN